MTEEEAVDVLTRFLIDSENEDFDIAESRASKYVRQIWFAMDVGEEVPNERGN